MTVPMSQCLYDSSVKSFSFRVMAPFFQPLHPPWGHVSCVLFHQQGQCPQKSAAISRKPMWIHAMADPHCWSTNFAGIVSGKLARKMGLLPPYVHCSLTPIADPTRKSSISFGSIPVLSISAGSSLASSSSAFSLWNQSLPGSFGLDRD